MRSKETRCKKREKKKKKDTFQTLVQVYFIETLLIVWLKKKFLLMSNVLSWCGMGLVVISVKNFIEEVTSYLRTFFTYVILMYRVMFQSSYDCFNRLCTFVVDFFFCIITSRRS